MLEKNISMRKIVRILTFVFMIIASVLFVFFGLKEITIFFGIIFVSFGYIWQLMGIKKNVNCNNKLNTFG